MGAVEQDDEGLAQRFQLVDDPLFCRDVVFAGYLADGAAAVAAGETAVNSPMPGNIFKVECSVGQAVKAGDVLVVLEAMKMEIEVSAPVDGTVKAVAATVGTAVNTDDLLVTLG